MLQNNVLESSHYFWRLVAETHQDKVPLVAKPLRPGGMSWKVASSVQKFVVDGSWSNGLPLFGYCACMILSSILLNF